MTIRLLTDWPYRRTDNSGDVIIPAGSVVSVFDAGTEAAMIVAKTAATSAGPTTWTPPSEARLPAYDDLYPDEVAAIQALVSGDGIPRVIYVKNTASSKADDNTSETDLASFVIQANTFGANDSIRITHMWQYPNSATSKNIKMVIGAATVLSFSATTTQKFQGIEIGRCRGSTSAQIWANDQLPFQTRAAAALTTAIDFTVDNTLRVVGSWGTAGVGSNLLTLESVIVEILPAPVDA